MLRPLRFSRLFAKEIPVFDEDNLVKTLGLFLQEKINKHALKIKNLFNVSMKLFFVKLAKKGLLSYEVVNTNKMMKRNKKSDYVLSIT